MKKPRKAAISLVFCYVSVLFDVQKVSKSVNNFRFCDVKIDVKRAKSDVSDVKNDVRNDVKNSAVFIHFLVPPGFLALFNEFISFFDFFIAMLFAVWYSTNVSSILGKCSICEDFELIQQAFITKQEVYYEFIP